MKNNLNYKFYCKHLPRFDNIMIYIHFIISVMIVMFMIIKAYRNTLSIVILLMSIPILSIDVFEGIDCLERCSFRSYFSAYSKLLQYSYICMALGLFFICFTILFNNPLMLSMSIIFIVISFNCLYYIWHPVYLDKQLSLDNMFHSIHKPIDFINLLFVIPEFIIILIVVLFYYAMKVMFKLDKVAKVFKYNNIHIQFVKINNKVYFKARRFTARQLKTILIKRYKLSHKISLKSVKNLTNYDNIKCLKILEPRLDKIFMTILLYTCAILLLLLVSMIVLSLIYSLINKIYRYKTVIFDTKLTFCMFKFPILIAPTFFILKKIIKFFEKNPSELSMGSALVIIFFFPFIGVFYILYTINSLDKIKV